MAAVERRKKTPKPTAAKWQEWEARLLAGEDPKQAAEAIGQTCTSFRLDDTERQKALLALAREARADEYDKRLEGWVADGTEQMRMYAHRYHAGRAGRTVEQVQVEVRTDVADALDRFTSAVEAAAVRRVARGGAELDAGEPERDGGGGARLAVARVAGAAESG